MPHCRGHERRSGQLDRRSHPKGGGSRPGRVLDAAVGPEAERPRGPLQAEARTLPTDTKIALIERLADAGHAVIEATSFVSPTAVPQPPPTTGFRGCLHHLF